MSPDPSWHPLLTGELAAEAWQSIHEIAEAVRPEAWIGRPEETAFDRGPALAGGAAGLALFFAYLAEATGEAQHAEAAERWLDRAIDLLAETPLPPSLYSGFTGIGWVATHLMGRPAAPGEEQAGEKAAEELAQEGEGEDEDGGEELDTAMVSLLGHSPWLADYDLIGGLAGFAVYLQERLPRPAARQGLALVIDRLAETSERSAAGTTWFTPPERLVGPAREVTPEGYYNLGLAHGLPAVIAVLSFLSPTDPASRDLLEGAVSWMLSRRLPPGTGAGFPAWWNLGLDVQPSRLAWCYGDPGVAGSLLPAARRAGREDWEREARQIALAAAQRSDETSGIRDAGLCHGAAGLGHIFNRLYQSTGDETLAAAARHWLRRTLDMRHPGEGVAGYRAWDAGADGSPAWKDEPGFLIGAAGIGLALLAAVAPVEPAWDRVLLLS